MDNDKDIISKYNRQDGMKVPEGYFDDFAKRMEAALPDKTDSYVVEVPRTTWQRIRPYAYMAAMFAGVWCMLKMFSMIIGSSTMPIDSNPIVAEALESKGFITEYVMSEVSQWDVYDHFIEEDFDAEMLDEAFAIVPTTLNTIEE